MKNVWILCFSGPHFHVCRLYRKIYEPEKYTVFGFFSSSVILDKKDNKQIKKFSAIWITNLLYLQPAIRLVFETHINGNLVMPLSNNSSIFRKSWTKYNVTPRHSSNVANLPSHITLLLAYYRILTHLALL